MDHAHAPVAGYTDRFSVRPGERLTVMASASEPDCEARLLRISHDGRTPVGAPEPVRIPHGAIERGSYGRVDGVPPTPAFTLATWIWPTALPAEAAGILAHGDRALRLLADGHVELTVAGATCRTRYPLALRRWYFVAGGCSPEQGARLLVWPRKPLCGEAVPGEGEAPARGEPALREAAVPSGFHPVLLAACPDGDDVGHHLDGKLDAPRLFDRLLDAHDVEALARDRAEPRGVVAAWDLSREIGTDRIVDRTGRHHGRLHNLPLRAVTGHDWTGDVLDWRFADRGYGAVHFHSDDVEDAGFDPVLTLDIPKEAPSGFYAVELRSNAGADRIPFFVRPRRDAAPAPRLLLVPTLSYLAYALDHLRLGFRPEQIEETAAEFARANALHSLYDRHADGSGVALASARRPLLGMRDDHVFRYIAGPHQYSEDVMLAGWLDRQGLGYDVATDHDLDEEGDALLASYRTLITGSHPEYWTARMLDAVEAHVTQGGRLAYLGGNPCYWVTAIDPRRRHVAELRRGFAGVRTWASEPGELHLATTGEPGGLWEERGRSAHRLLGVGSAAAGMTVGAPYRIETDDPPPPASWTASTATGRSAASARSSTPPRRSRPTERTRSRARPRTRC